MTRNRKKKLAVRAEAAGGPYARAARVHDAERAVVLTADVHKSLLRAFESAGWPVEHDGFPEGGVWTSWLGPVWATLSRPAALSGEEHPDDPDFYDLTTPPELCFITPHIPIETGEAMVLELPGTTPGPELVQRVGARLARARASELAKSVNDASCALCGDRYPSAHLLPPTETDELLVCPFCVFDGDVLGTHPLRLAFAIDELTDQDVAAPAGWCAVAALLACAAGPDLGQRLEELGVLRAPLPHWFDPGQVWVWLPPGDLPPALEHLTPGTSLAALAEAVERAHPDLRSRFRAEVAATWEEDSEDTVRGDYLVEQLWPAAICYAVAVATQTRERPDGRSPWDLLNDGFEEGNLHDVFGQIGSILNAHTLGPGLTLSIGATLIAKALGWDRDPDFP